MLSTGVKAEIEILSSLRRRPQSPDFNLCGAGDDIDLFEEPGAGQTIRRHPIAQYLTDKIVAALTS